METNNGGYLVPLNLHYEIVTQDLKPIKPKWWQVWRVSKYKKDLLTWQDRFSDWVIKEKY